MNYYNFWLKFVILLCFFSVWNFLGLKKVCFLFTVSVQDSKGNDVDLSIYKGKVLLIVNVASKWYFVFLISKITGIVHMYILGTLDLLPCESQMPKRTLSVISTLTSFFFFFIFIFCFMEVDWPIQTTRSWISCMKSIKIKVW